MHSLVTVEMLGILSPRRSRPWTLVNPGMRPPSTTHALYNFKQLHNESKPSSALPVQVSLCNYYCDVAHHSLLEAPRKITTQETKANKSRVQQASESLSSSKYSTKQRLF